MASVRECKEMIRATLGSSAPLSLMLWGAPGIGKTSLVHQVATDMGVGFKSVIAHLYQPVDVLGLPYVVDGRCDYAPPTIFPDADRDGPRGVFFLDELPNCVPAMQSAWGIVVLERSTKHYKFPPGWIIVCAGNRETDRAGSSRLVSALENRLIHIAAEPSSDEFMAYAVARGLHASVPAFLEERKDMLLKFDPKSPERAFPSPRAWERVSDIMKLGIGAGPQGEMVKGAIGAGSAVEFMAFMKIFNDLPKLSDVLAGEVDLAAIKRPDILRAIVYSVLAWTGEKPEEARLNKAIGVALKMSDEWSMLMLTRLWELAPSVLLGASGWKQMPAKFLEVLALISGQAMSDVRHTMILHSLVEAIADGRTLAWSLEHVTDGRDPVAEAWQQIERNASSMRELLFILRGKPDDRWHGPFMCNPSDCTACVAALREIVPMVSLAMCLEVAKKRSLK